MFGFPPHAAPDTVMAVVDGIMSRMPHLSYAAECAMNNGFPVANLTFPDLGSAKQAVQKLHGQCHGALRISMELISSLQAQPVPQAPHAHAAGPSQRPAGMQPIPHHPRPPPRVLPTGNVVPWQTNQQPYSAPVTGFPNGVASSSGQTRAPQPFLGHASGSPANFGGPAPPPPPAAVGGHVMSGRPTGSDAGGRVTACVQQSSDRPKLIQKILEQFRGDAWQTCKEYEDLKVKLSRMKVSWFLLVYFCLLAAVSTRCVEHYIAIRPAARAWHPHAISVSNCRNLRLQACVSLSSFHVLISCSLCQITSCCDMFTSCCFTSVHLMFSVSLRKHPWRCRVSMSTDDQR